MEKQRFFAKDLSRVVIGITSVLLLTVGVSVGIISYKISIRESIQVMRSQLERLIDFMTMREQRAEVDAVSLSSYFFQNDDHSLASVSKYLNTELVDDQICEKTIYLHPDVFRGDSATVLYVSHWEKSDSLPVLAMKMPLDKYTHGFDFLSAEIDTLLWVGPFLEEADQKPYLGCIYKVCDEDGKVVGFTEVLFDQGPLYQTIGEEQINFWNLKLYTGDSELREHLKDFHYYEGKDLSLPLDSLSITADEVREIDYQGRKYYFYGDDSEGELSVITKLANDWVIKMSCYRAVAFRDAGIIVAGVFVFLVLGLLLLQVVIRKIIYKRTRPILQFSEAAASIAGQNFETYLPSVSRNDEIRTLRDALDNMQSSLKNYVRELEFTTAAKVRMESELNIAADIQQQILQKTFPNDERFDLHASMQPAREVGGDMYDFELEGDNLYFMIGDVSGKGVPAALIMTVATSMFRHLAVTTDISLGKIISHINDTIAYGNKNNMFLTILAGMIDLSTREMTICNAGHNPMLLFKPGEVPQFHRTDVNSVCGVFSDLEFSEETITIPLGTRILFYTDGVTEAMNESDGEYGEERLLKWAESIADEISEKEVLDSLMTDVKSFAGDAEQSDDITMFGVKVK